MATESKKAEYACIFGKPDDAAVVTWPEHLRPNVPAAMNHLVTEDRKHWDAKGKNLGECPGCVTAHAANAARQAAKSTDPNERDKWICVTVLLTALIAEVTREVMAMTAAENVAEIIKTSLEGSGLEVEIERIDRLPSPPAGPSVPDAFPRGSKRGQA